MRERQSKTETKLSPREKALELINAYFDGKEIIVKDPICGIENWTSIKDSRYWTHLAKFCEKVDCYKIIE